MSTNNSKDPPAERSLPGLIREETKAGRLFEFDSAQLFGGRKEVSINHRGEVYRLRITAAGKLILTK